jgi:hypothetical protein
MASTLIYPTTPLQRNGPTCNITLTKILLGAGVPLSDRPLDVTVTNWCRNRAYVFNQEGDELRAANSNPFLVQLWSSTRQDASGFIIGQAAWGAKKRRLAFCFCHNEKRGFKGSSSKAWTCCMFDRSECALAEEGGGVGGDIVA